MKRLRREEVGEAQGGLVGIELDLFIVTTSSSDCWGLRQRRAFTSLSRAHRCWLWPSAPWPKLVVSPSTLSQVASYGPWRAVLVDPVPLPTAALAPEPPKGLLPAAKHTACAEPGVMGER